MSDGGRADMSAGGRADMSAGGRDRQELRITGMPTAAELAAVLVLLAAQPAPATATATAYERWRRTRTAALKRSVELATAPIETASGFRVPVSPLVFRCW